MRKVLLALPLFLVLAACGGAAPAPAMPPPADTGAPAPSAEPSAASSAAPSAAASSTPAPSAACAGKVDAPDGLKEVTDPDLLKQALGEPGKGALCMGKVFEAVRPVTVFRVWNQAKRDTAMGRWWSFAKPAGSVDAFRHANSICPEWSDLNYYNECHIKVGAHIVVGPGQSAACKATKLEQSPTNQVFIPNDTRDPKNQKVFVERCSSGSTWP